MTHDERRELARALAAIDLPHPLLDPRLRRRRRLALLAFIGARRLFRATVAAAYQAGEVTPADEMVDRRAPAGTRGCSVPAGQVHSLRHTPLVGQGIDEALPRSRAQRRAEQADRARQSA